MSRHVSVMAEDKKNIKQNGRQAAILDWIAKQNEVHMYVVLPGHFVKFEKISSRHECVMA